MLEDLAYYDDGITNVAIDQALRALSGNGLGGAMRKGAMLVGYARVSKADDQDTAAQVKALRQAGCKRIFEEKASGGRWDRPHFTRPWNSSGKEMCWSSGSSTDYHGL